MKAVTLTLIFFCTIVAIACSKNGDDNSGTDQTNNDQQAQTIDYNNLTMVWNDEFDGTSVDLTKWNYRAEGTARTYGVVDRSTIQVDGTGYVHIKVLKDPVSGKYLIGELGTDKLFSQRYGYFECRAKMNHTLGPHVAFWLQSPTVGNVGDPAVNGTEIDVFEYHRKTPGVVYHNLHWDGYGASHQTVGAKINYPQVAQDFHTFSLLWTPTTYTFFVDGKETWTTHQAVSQVPEYIILSTELSGWGGDPSLGTFPDEVIFDYVRVYKQKGVNW